VLVVAAGALELQVAAVLVVLFGCLEQR